MIKKKGPAMLRLLTPVLLSSLLTSALFCSAFPAIALTPQVTPPVSFSVMVGATEMTQATLWVQTPQSARVRVYVQAADTPQKGLWSPVYNTQAEDYFSVQIPLTDLKPQTDYSYQIEINGQIQPTTYAHHFRSQPLWRNRTAPPTLRFALGSCVYLNDPESDVPGYAALGGNYEVFESIRKTQPDFMLWMGDNVYLREPDFFSAQRIERRYRQLRELPEARPLLASLPHYAIWDDHDYGSNDGGSSYRMREQVLDIFKHFWPNPSGGHPKTEGIYTRFEWGDAEFFLTDNRFFRAANQLNDPNKDFFGPAQWQWLKDSLASSPASFKFIVIGNQVLNTQTPSENFYSYSREYKTFMDWLVASKIPGIVILSGDRHHSELLKKTRKSSYPLYEYTVSPLTSKAYPPFPAEQVLPERVPGSLVEKRNFGLIQISGPAGQRVLELKTFDTQGKLLWSQKIDQTELQP
jgi:alkaline phosphatase D